MSEKNKIENHPPRILLIDDDEEFTDDLIFLLDGPYQVVAAHESKKAVELLEKEEFDLVILDIEMPAFYADEDEKEGTGNIGDCGCGCGGDRGLRAPAGGS